MLPMDQRGARGGGAVVATGQHVRRRLRQFEALSAAACTWGKARGCLAPVGRLKSRRHHTILTAIDISNQAPTAGALKLSQAFKSNLKNQAAPNQLYLLVTI